MTYHNLNNRSFHERFSQKIDLEQFFSVEIPVNELGVIYQFKVWRTESMNLYVLVKEDSGILPWIQVGENLTMKYYSNNIFARYQNYNTEVRFITRQQYGRLRGHYLVGLEINEKTVRDRTQFTHIPEEDRAMSYNALLRNV